MPAVYEIIGLSDHERRHGRKLTLHKSFELGRKRIIKERETEDYKIRREHLGGNFPHVVFYYTFARRARPTAETAETGLHLFILKRYYISRTVLELPHAFDKSIRKQKRIAPLAARTAVDHEYFQNVKLPIRSLDRLL